MLCQKQIDVLVTTDAVGLYTKKKSGVRCFLLECIELIVQFVIIIATHMSWNLNYLIESIPSGLNFSSYENKGVNLVILV